MTEKETHLTTTQKDRILTRSEFQGLAESSAEIKWFANLNNKKTRRAYLNDLKEFITFTGIAEPEEFHREKSLFSAFFQKPYRANPL